MQSQVTEVGWALVLFCFRNKIEVVNRQGRIYARVLAMPVSFVECNKMQASTGTKSQNSYEGPVLKKLLPEEAKKFLLHHAELGDQGAKELLALVRPTGKAAR